MVRKIPIHPDFYYTVSGGYSQEIKIKASRFIGTLDFAVSRDAAEKCIGDLTRQYHDATHNCYAYRISQSDFRYSDDGEPGGTAGKPILEVLDRHHLSRVVLVVTRYFGGTKLGTGGLIRAYSACAEQVITRAKIIRKYHYQTIDIQYPFDMISKVQHLVQQFRGRIEQDATPDGMKARIWIIPSKLRQFKEKLLDSTGARAVIIGEMTDDP
jgi:uncharacterized YigZ family protein